MSVSFADIRAMLGTFVPVDFLGLGNADRAFKILDEKGFSFLPDTRRAVTYVACAQNAAWPTIKHPRAAFYASAYDRDNEKTQTRLQDLAEGRDSALRLCALSNADLRVYELDMVVTRMDEASAAHALSYGLMAVDDHVDLLVLGSVSADVNTALTAWDHAMGSDPLSALLVPGVGQDVAAMFGAALGARMGKIPVVCGTTLYPVLMRALTALLGENNTGFVFTLTDTETAGWPDELQALAAVQRLKTTLALMATTQHNLQTISQAA